MTNLLSSFLKMLNIYKYLLLQSMPCCIKPYYLKLLCQSTVRNPLQFNHHDSIFSNKTKIRKMQILVLLQSTNLLQSYKLDYSISSQRANALPLELQVQKTYYPKLLSINVSKTQLDLHCYLDHPKSYPSTAYTKNYQLGKLGKMYFLYTSLPHVN